VAIFNLVAKAISRRKWPTVVKAAAYISGEKLESYKKEEVYNYARRQDVLFRKIMAPPGAPEWARDREPLWNNVDRVETRWNARLARVFQIALPWELTLGQNIELVEKFCGELVLRGAGVDYAIHGAKMNRDQRNTHVHIMATTRVILSEGFGEKIQEWNDKAYLYRWRQLWQDLTNSALEKAGLDCRVDCRSHASKGLDLEPMLHLGFKDMAIERAGLQSERGNINREIMARNEIRMKQMTTPALERNDTENAAQQAAGHEKQVTELQSDSITISLDPLKKSVTLPRDSLPVIIPVGDTLDKLEDALNPTELICEPHLAQLKCQIENSTDGREQNRLELLRKLKNNEFVTIEDCKKQLDQLSTATNQRLLELKAQINDLNDNSVRERLHLQIQIEESEFKHLANQIQDAVFHAMDAIKYVGDISACRHRARGADREHKKHIAEWNKRAVRDTHYPPTDPVFSNLIAKARERESRTWSEFKERAKANQWDPIRIEKESRLIQSRLDYALNKDFGLEKTHEMSR